MRMFFLYSIFICTFLILNCKDDASANQKIQQEDKTFQNTQEVIVPTRVQPAKFYASNILDPGVNYSYEPENAFDGNINTTWATKGFNGKEYLQVDFYTKTNISFLNVYNGFVGVKKYWSSNSRAKDITIECDGNLVYSGTLLDTDQEQTIQLKNEISCNRLKFNILSPYYPKKGDKDLCITDIEIFGKNNSSTKRDNPEILNAEEKKIVSLNLIRNEEIIKKALKELLQKYKNDSEKNIVINIPDNVIDPKEARQLSSTTMKIVMDDGRFKIVERESLGRILKEQALQQTGITEETEIGKIAGANLTLLVLLTEGFLEFKLIDTKTSQIYSYSSASLR